MAEKAACIVLSSIEGKGAFGIRVDTDSSVYFPLGVAEALELEDFDDVEAILVRNERSEPVWKAIRCRRLNDRNEPSAS